MDSSKVNEYWTILILFPENVKSYWQQSQTEEGNGDTRKY